MLTETLKVEYLKEVLEYDPETGIFTWKQRPRHHFDSDWMFKRWNSYRAGMVAGRPTAKNYIKLTISGITHQGHRLAWFYVYGEWPECIDHINHCASDNRISNLRSVTPATNQLNRSLAKKNRSGVCGVIWNKANKKWLVNIRINRHQKYFGSFTDWFEAVCRRKSMDNMLGFHPNHGR